MATIVKSHQPMERNKMIVITSKTGIKNKITKQKIKMGISAEDKKSRDQFLSFVVLNGSDDQILAVAEMVKEVIAKTKKIEDIQNGLAIEATLRWQAQDVNAGDIIEVEKILAEGRGKERNKLAKLIEHAIKCELPADEFRNCFVIN
jgi:hypothetical protein